MEKIEGVCCGRFMNRPYMVTKISASPVGETFRLGARMAMEMMGEDSIQR